jgi:malic enzyme
MFLGAGAAATGIARLLTRGLGADPTVAGDRPPIAMLDSHGLLFLDRAGLGDDQRPFAVDTGWLAATGLSGPDLSDPLAVARAFRPTVLIGTTGTAGAFSESLVREVAAHADTPIILPLSNPGERSEAQPQQVLDWTDGRALVATGSPSTLPVVSRTIGQANNVFIFPGVGLGALVAEAREVTDEAFLAAAETLAASVSPARLRSGGIFPPIGQLRGIARQIAIAVVRRLRDTGHGRQLRDEEIEPAVDGAMWVADYVPYRPG